MAMEGKQKEGKQDTLSEALPYKNFCGLTDNLICTVTFIGTQNIHFPDMCQRRGIINCSTMTQ